MKNQWEANFAQSAIPFRVEDIIEYVQEQQLENLIAVDATASSDIVKSYIPLIQNGFNIVAANKKANTLHNEFYQEIRRNLKKATKHFFTKPMLAQVYLLFKLSTICIFQAKKSLK